MIRITLTFLATIGLLLGAAGCDKMAKSTKAPESQEEKARNIGDKYVRGVLGTGNNAKGTVEIVAITKAIQMYQAEKGSNPPSLAALQSAGFLSTAPVAPPGKKFEYDPASGSVKLVSQ